jgi:hypothetical protein
MEIIEVVRMSMWLKQINHGYLINHSNAVRKLEEKWEGPD